MIFHTDKMELKSIQTVLKSEANAVYVCQDKQAKAGNLYVVWTVDNHDLAKKLLTIFHSDGNDSSPLVTIASDQGMLLLVFPYCKNRLLVDFYPGNRFTLSECEEICRNLVLSCISSGLPWPILYLIINNRQVHMASDRNVYLGYYLDLTELDENITEKDCTVACAKFLLELLEPHSTRKAISYELLTKRSSSGGYSRFSELYKDILIAAAPGSKMGMWSKLKRSVYRVKDPLFTVLLIICMILLILAVVSLICQLLLGDVPWLRIFNGSFNWIGTESLKQ